MSSSTLSDILSAKGHDVEFGDFLEHRGQCDRIVMNPPFEDGTYMVHIRHTFEQLRTGGRLVSVVSDGPFFRVDKRSVAFRNWLANIAVDVERLPEDADAFRETGVRTRFVTATK